MDHRIQETRATCPYCGVGCGVLIQHDGARVFGVRGDPDHPANRGRLCTKGATLHLTTQQAGRALYPELRRDRQSPRHRVGWDEALRHAAERFAAVIREQGPDAVAFYISGQLLTEDYYAFNKLAKGLVGTNNVDSNSRLCMSSAVAGYKMTLGADAPPACYDDLDQAQCIVFAGSNAAYAHPVLFRRVEAAKAANPELKIVVIDPRRTDTASIADLHLALRPGTDVALFNAILNVMLWEGWIDGGFIGAHTAGFTELKAAVREFTPHAVAAMTGLRPEDIVTAARWFATSPATLSLYCQGLNQSVHGAHNNAALINLHLAAGQIGRPGAGPFSLTGQPNAMGGREVGGMANLASGHRDLADPAHRAEIAALWRVESVPEKPGRTAVELFEAVHRGEIGALWIACTNPAQSLPEQALVHEALARCPYVVLQEACADTETAPYADLLLPAATWGEKQGTVTNSERRITLTRRAVPAPGEARADWLIVRDFAHALGAALGRGDEARRLFPWTGPEQIFAEHAESTRGRDLDITGLSHDLLEREGPQQWPYPEGAAAGTARLYTDGRFATADGRARFVVPQGLAAAEKTDARHPFALTTGRLRDQWHGMSRTGRAARLWGHAAGPRLALNAGDAARRGLAAGDLVRVKNRRGALVVPLEISAELPPGVAWMPMHWGRNTLNSAGVNLLMPGACDPHSKQPELKHAAVAVERAELPWRGFLARIALADDAERAVQWKQRLAQAVAPFAWAEVTLAGHARSAVAVRVAHGETPPAEWIAALDEACDLEPTLNYVDGRRGIAKAARIEDGRLTGIRLAGETAAAGWLLDVLTEAGAVDPLRPYLFAPLATPPAGRAPRGRVVCNCLDVSENEILAEIARGADLPRLQQTLRCGTSCGSCVPEIRGLLAARSAAA